VFFLSRADVGHTNILKYVIETIHTREKKNDPSFEKANDVCYENIKKFIETVK
jgi:hypothetical protein